MNVSLHPDFLKLSKNRRYLLGISGGRDSVALLHTLLAAGFHKLVLCHLNHGLRGKESGQDAAFVRRAAKKHDLPCEIGRVNMDKLMKENGESMELAARNARQRFFRVCAKTYRCKRVLLAHHADDQAETILFNLLRGSNGLKGMQFTASHQVGDMRLEMLRPFLNVTRNQIDIYLADHHIKYRDDASNAQAVATRNRLRNEAIPLLNDIMGRDIRPAVLRAEAASQSLQSAAGELLSSIQTEDPQGRLYLPKLVELSPVMQSTVIHNYLKKHGIPNVSHHLLERCITLITDPSTAKINLPGDRFFRRKEKRLFII